ncbi:ATP synthase subunit K, mitochondrial [Naviculisporaceae sp. PSN 640]
MGASYYTIFGRQVGSHHLAMLTLGTLFGGSYLATRPSGAQKAATVTPPINAASSDEFDFIKKFMDSAEADEKKAPESKH